MDKVDILIVGAGVVGLAIAERLARPGRSIVVAERNESFGRETSSRNSEVIHCGMYYPENLLKTRLCVRGNPLLYERCEKDGIPARKTGKIVVAVDDQEARVLQHLLSQGRRNGVRGLRLIYERELRELEPCVRGVLGLLSPESGIVNSHLLMTSLQQSAAARGVTFGYRCDVHRVTWTGAGFVAELTDADTESMSLNAECVVNAAGLDADRVAQSAGIDIDAAGYRIHPAKGEYFRVSSRHRGKLARLVYPVPSPVHLGAHAVLGLDGGLKIGPNSVSAVRGDYSVDPAHREEFLAKASRFLPFLEAGDLSPDMAGIRPKLYRLGEPLRDFVIREETSRGLPGLVNLVGMESPGLTSCLTIAEEVERVLGAGAAAAG
ncbi:MAG: NAD(P)/FAD-dependent oxidoreductase [Spirochaetia bacterium]